MKYLFLLLSIILISSCQRQEEEITAQDVIDRTIERAGGERFKRATVEFRFRDHTYKSIRNGGEFHLERNRKDSIGHYRDILSNTGYQRFLNDSLLTVPDSMVVRYSSSVNSVHYFAHLPYGLNDRAVNKEMAGEAVIKGEPYYQLKITFQQEGGGADHHDEFMYWIHKKNYTIDYLAYKFQVNDGGIRFRAAYNPRVIGGLRFVDYKNYTIEDLETRLEELDELYEQGQLDMLSNIKTEILNVEVR
ncbi:deoxyribose-phosphate aldolase [Antarcticibacterium flavum]|uniref:Deoxyribose-phosphate aldolase n=1 Tax=Antarcticibacterium flavum TaxID=2058175 RepID=A0A5B7X212_9FLAO|nr:MULTISPECIES: DUF6503 family protein [Antarcticibacterium]MCM4160774.1 deoxyribose-phosphate aldolase [Antarcticibacterium sp. W02-3]QCY68752.1 deoxyribose-phosphate aldolase [Antarcticibacterium flavum]